MGRGGSRAIRYVARASADIRAVTRSVRGFDLRRATRAARRRISLPRFGRAVRRTSYLMLGELYRSRGDFGPARAMYRLALHVDRRRSSDRMAVRAAIAQMAREERPVAAFAPLVGDDPGWQVSTEGVGDNLGVHYAASTLRRTVPLGGAMRAGLAVVSQYLGERSSSRSIDLIGDRRGSIVLRRSRLRPAVVSRRTRGRRAASPGRSHDSHRDRDGRRVGEHVGARGAAVDRSGLSDAPHDEAVRPLTGTGDAITEHAAPRRSVVRSAPRTSRSRASAPH